LGEQTVRTISVPAIEASVPRVSKALRAVGVEARGVVQDQRAEHLLETRALRVVELAPGRPERALRHGRKS
jgi:hypothetical protein